MALLTPSQITTLYQQALALQSKGQSEKALGLYSQILDSKQDVAEVHFQVGRIFFAGNKFQKSVFHYMLAAQLKPNEVAIWSEFIPSLLCNVDPVAVKKAGKILKTAKLDKNIQIGLQNRLFNNANGSSVPIGALERSGLDIVQQAILERDYKRANNLASAFFQKHPKQPVAAELLARTYLNLNELDAARKYFKLAISFSPAFFDAHNHLGQAEMIAENYAVAITHFKNAVVVAPRAVAGICNLAHALARSGSATLAVELLNHAKSLHLKGGKIDLSLGELHARAGQFDIAQKHYKAGLKREKITVPALTAIGDVFNKMEQLQLSLDYYDQAQILDPLNHEIFYRRATALRQLGHFESSLEEISKAIDLSPNSAAYMSFYTASKKVEKDDPIVGQMIALLEAPETSIEERTELGFGIVKALEDSKEYNRVFHYLKQANDDMHERYPYDVNDFVSEIDAVMDYFSDFKLANFHDLGDPNAQPIFVCGMPRSGTTLVEQIISSHSDVIGAGEVGVTSVIEKNVLERDDKSLIPLAGVGAPELQKLGKDIWHHLEHHFPGGPRISDKSIQTYKRMGILKAAMPNCKIIVVRRDPRDNLLSIYRNKFHDGTHLYAYDLSDLGAYYKQFLRVLDFWREKMPEGFMEIHYEDLIDDPEKHARSLIDYCDLEWQDDCLNFHKSKRQVKTLSVLQVRQPIYKSSLKAWQRYEEDLQPLFEALK